MTTLEEERTDVGLPEMRFRLHEPTGGGGGLIEVDGKQVQLTTTQFELMALMIRRMAAEAHQPELVRGFVRSSELIADLSWDTREPSENHVKQLVRRVRRALIKSEIGDLIESRHRFGYRLRAIPTHGVTCRACDVWLLASRLSSAALPGVAGDPKFEYGKHEDVREGQRASSGTRLAEAGVVFTTGNSETTTATARHQGVTQDGQQQARARGQR